MSVADLQREVGIAASHLSQHLAVLRRHLLVESERRGSHVYYRLSDPAAAELLAAARRLLLLLGVLVRDEARLAAARGLPAVPVPE